MKLVAHAVQVDGCNFIGLLRLAYLLMRSLERCTFDGISDSPVGREKLSSAIGDC